MDTVDLLKLVLQVAVPVGTFFLGRWYERRDNKRPKVEVKARKIDGGRWDLAIKITNPGDYALDLKTISVSKGFVVDLGVSDAPRATARFQKTIDTDAPLTLTGYLLESGPRVTDVVFITEMVGNGPNPEKYLIKTKRDL